MEILTIIATVVTIIGGIFAIYEFLIPFLKNKKKTIQVNNENVATRFIRLFESHGVHRNQIPRFFGYGLTLADVKNDEILLGKLSEEMLDAACELFAVRREWLDGAEKQIHIEHNFYKWPDRFEKFLNNLHDKNPDGDITGVLIVPAEAEWGANALLILQETVGYIGDKSIYRFHLCNDWAYTYWKARAYLTACIAIAWKNNNYIHAITKPRDFIDELAYGETLLGWNGEGIWDLGHKSFDPEYMAFRPETFLHGLDTQRGNFGLKAGLELWLQLSEQGLMDAGFGDHSQAFADELEKYAT